MPATEQTWRNLKTLHVVFGASALIMLLITVWLLAADHNREAKGLQKQFGLVETRYLEWRRGEQLTTDYETKQAELEKQLRDARAEVPARDELDAALKPAIAQKQADPKLYNYDIDAVERAYADLKAASEEPIPADADAKQNEKNVAAHQEKVGKARDRFFRTLQAMVNQATFVENESQRKLKFTKADLDVDMSMLAIGVDEGKPAQELEKTQEKVSTVRSEVDNTLTVDYQTKKAHRLELQNAVAAMRADEATAQKAIEKHDSEYDRLNTAVAEKAPNAGKWLLGLPILDAFGGPLKPQQVWLPDLTWNNNFRNVARFDRCVTCHQGIDKSAPGSAVDPAYPHAEEIVLEMATPKVEPGAEWYAKSTNERLYNLYGMHLSETSLFNVDDVTVGAVFPNGAAIKSGMRAGDVIVKVGNTTLVDKTMAPEYLLQSVTWGKPLVLTVRRGVPEPYASHPRLDLFVGSMSPHKVGEMGCTICHEGQGNGTSFRWTSHTPNDPLQAAAWKRDQGWFNNHHWIYPMLPNRFQEANCLKCHHELTELKPSERFPEAPAPKLMAGYEMIESVGCFGCHEIGGYDGPKKRRGPDLRAEPNYFAAAAQVAADPKLKGATGELNRIADLARQVTQHPEQTASRKLLAELIQRDAAGGADGKAPQLSAATHAMGPILGADDETPGKYNKVGPSLRYVASKNDLAFLYSWIMDPKNYRPTTKMPQFFGLRKHLVDVEQLDGNGNVVMETDAEGHEHPKMVKSEGRKDSERFEPIEVLAVSKYLMTESQPFEFIPPVERTAAGQTIEAPDVARGKLMFQTRGCLACHSHADFPDIHKENLTAKNGDKVHEAPAMATTQGPDLSGLGAKLTDEKGKQWLYTWLKQPNLYHARTVMPNLLLEPVTETTMTNGQPSGSKTYDPAADIALYLMSHKVPVGHTEAWKAEAVPTYEGKNLDDLLRFYLVGAFTKSETEKVIKSGVPADRRSTVKGDETMLVVDSGKSWNDDMKLMYLGKKTIGRLGCAGCHDIPGFEDAKPIGTGLADWGRKEPSKLAFEQVLAYLHTGEGGHGGHAEAQEDPAKIRDEGFFMDALGHHQREGFLWQKLREPRSYDYMKTENKSYIDRLRMPQFNLSPAQREAIMTFVLGLVAEPPPAKYIYQPNPRQQAVLAGQKVIEKYNCAGCHTLKMQTWEIDYMPGKPKAPDVSGEYSFLIPHYSPQEITKSKAVDRRGLGHAEIHGLPEPKEDEEDPTVYFKLWSPTLIDGQTWLSGGTSLGVDETVNPPNKTVKRPQIGGVFANYLHPVALKEEKTRNPAVKETDAWGFVPPPLIGQGAKVQTRWLHDFLLEPFQIRPAAILRMPKFHMTSAEAEAIVAHFAAVDNVDYPYEFDRRQQSDYLSSADAAYEKNKKEAQAAAARNPAPAAATPPAPGAAPTATVPPGDDGRLDDALRLVTDNGFCVKCHLVGDFRPAGAAAGLAPNLAGVSTRLRPDYLKKWIANPTRILPYTGMPVNFPKSQLVAQHLYKGTSEEQIDAIVDFLVNYDRVLSERTKIVDFIKTAAVTPAASTNPAAAGGNPTPSGGAPAAGGSTPRPTLPSSPPPPSSPTPGGSAPSGSPPPSGSGTPTPPPAGNSPNRPAE